MKRCEISNFGFAILCALIAAPAAGQSLPLTYEVRVPADEPDVFGYIYICFKCTPENWDSVIAPDGAMKTRDRLRLMEAQVTPRDPPPGVPALLDLSPAIPGPEMVYTARALSIKPVGYRFSSGVQIRARVERTTTFTYKAGSVVHELTDTDGEKWILFSVPLSKTIHDPAGEGTIDPNEIDAFAHLKGPWWWTYSSRVLDEDYVVSVTGIADVAAQTWGAAWQQITGDEPEATSVPIEELLSRERLDPSAP